MTVLTRAILDPMQCQHPDCTHEDHGTVFYLHAQCHPPAGSRVSYDSSTGILAVRCRQCDKLTAEIKVADA